MQHWKRVDVLGNTTTVESYSHDLPIDRAVAISQAEFDGYIASLPKLPPQGDPNAEFINSIKSATTVGDLKAALLARFNPQGRADML